MSVLTKVFAFLKSLYTSEPAVFISAGVAVVVGVASALGIVVDTTSAGSVVAYVLAILFGGVAVRSKVSPA